MSVATPPMEQPYATPSNSAIGRPRCGASPPSSGRPSRDVTAVAMGSIITAVAVLLIHMLKKADAIVKEGESCVERVPGQPRPEGGWPRIAASEDMKAVAAFAEAHPDEIASLFDEFQAVFQPEMKRIYARIPP